MSATPGHLTLHLIPAARWEAWCADPDPAARYAPEGFEAEGFVHCTDGDEALLAVANRFHADDPGPFVVLDLDLAVVDVPWRYDDPRSPYPHVYGPLRREAVRGARPVLRDGEGRFVGYGVRSGIATWGIATRGAAEAGPAARKASPPLHPVRGRARCP